MICKERREPVKGKTRLISGLAIISLLLTYSCASTIVPTVWVDETYNNKIEKVLVVGVSKKPGVRRMFEDEFGHQLKKHGVDAVSSHILVPFAEQLNKETIEPKIRDMEIDAVLITRLLDEKEVSEYRPKGAYVVPKSYLYGYHDYYSDSFSRDTGYKVEGRVVTLETNLYETHEEKLVWSSLSKTFVQAGSYKEIKSVIKAVMKQLSNQDFFQ
jgi:hypothetical protein